MKRNYFTFDMLNNTIVGSAASIKKAGDPTTPQYKELRSMKMKEPAFTVAVKDIARKKDKKTYNGLTIAAMRTFVESKKGDNALAEFNALCAEASYPIVKSWFLTNYKDEYKQKETKQAMTKQKIKFITSKHKVTRIPNELAKGA